MAGYDSSHNSANIEEVASVCTCSKDRAADLLRRVNNDVQKAIRHHQILSRYVNQRSLSPQRKTWGAPPRGDGPSWQILADIIANDILDNPEGLYSTTKRPTLTIPKQDKDHDLSTVVDLVPSNPLPIEQHSSKFDSTIGVTTYSPSPNPETPTMQVDNDLDEVLDTPCKDMEWDFVLPCIARPPTLEPGNDFNVTDLIGAITHGFGLESIYTYLEYYDRETVKAHINGNVYGFPAIFYAVASNDDMIVRTFIDYGANLIAVHEPSGTPLLAFAIVHSDTIREDTTAMVATLLSLGTPPNLIPSDLYTPYHQDLPDVGRVLDISNPRDPITDWCTDAARSHLQRTANLTQRYHLDRATKIKKASVRHRQVAKLKHAEPILGIPYFLIGQTMASGRLLQKLLSHLVIPSKRPLVLAFAGPSGHGKTELARRLGYLLGLDLEVVDCTIVRRELELFGPREPFRGAEKGSSINNFLARHAGERCIVFLDEFEKTTSDIHQALLLPFDNGEYQDRRNGSKVNCSKTIWILATNALDPLIKDFCSQHPEILGDDEATKQKMATELSRELKQGFLVQFGAPITGRISDCIPFLPFNPGEQAVVTHKFLLELARKVKAPVVLSDTSREQIMGNIHLRIRKDSSVCRSLATAEYSSDLGARSLATAVKLVEDKLVETYLEEEEEIVEGKGVHEFCVDMRGGEVVVHKIQD